MKRSPLFLGSLSVLAAIAVVVTAMVLVRARPAHDGEATLAPLPETSAPPGVEARHEIAGEAAFFEDAAVTAWNHFETLWQPATGLAKATPHYDRLTPWDIGSVLAALHSANRLGLLPDAEYERRLQITLGTLERMPLYRDAVFHKKYDAASARMVDRNNAVSSTGYGWSATDLGRLLVWLRIIAENDSPLLATAARRVAGRVKFSETVDNGYLYGGLIGTRGKLWKFQEGRVGYEQYAAQGFALWNARVENALDLAKNSRPVEVMGVQLLADTRGLDRLNSEPFVLAGLEFGWSQPFGDLALRTLAAQQARFEKTGLLTMVSEDALNVPPHYFYYYCVYCNGRPFVVDISDPGQHLDKPRWISTKAVFGWHVLVGSAYTRRVVQEIGKAKSDNAWSSGIFEKSYEPTRTYDINTTAVILEAALYRKLGRPLLHGKAAASAATH